MSNKSLNAVLMFCSNKNMESFVNRFEKQIQKLELEQQLLIKAEGEVLCLPSGNPFDLLTSKEVGKLNNLPLGFLESVLDSYRNEIKGTRRMSHFEWDNLFCSGLFKRVQRAIKARLEEISKEILSVRFHLMQKGEAMENFKGFKKISLALTASQKRKKHSLGWSPTKELSSLSLEAGIKISKSGRLVLPSIGSKETKDEDLQGFPMQALLSSGGGVDNHFGPQISFQTTSTEELVECWSKLAEQGIIRFVSANKGWNGPSQIANMFGKDGGARAYASLGSTNVKGIYQTKEEGIKCYIVNLSSKESIAKLLAEDPFICVNEEDFYTWIGNNPRSKVDGMSICGRWAMPAIKDEKKLSRVQFRVMNTETPEKLQEMKANDISWQKEISVELEKNKALPIEERKTYKEIYAKATKETVAKIEETRGKVQARYGKGLLVEMDFLACNVLLLDINALKCVQRKEIISEVEIKGFWEANDLLVGCLQDYGAGYMRLSWQAIMYFLEKLPANFPVRVTYKGKVTTMGDRFGFGPAIERFFDVVLHGVEEFSKGILNSNMKQILEFVLNEEGYSKEQADKLILGLWNNKIVRNEVSKYISSFLRRNKFGFITEGMSLLGDILPRKAYAIDMNELPGCTCEEDKPWELEIHDQILKVAPIYIKDDAMWSKLGVYECPFVFYKNPISDFRVIDAVIALDPRVYYPGSDLANGWWTNSEVVKNLFTGDTDGDEPGVWLCLVEIQGDKASGKWKAVADKDGWYAEDYCVLYSVTNRSFKMDLPITNVEDYVGNSKAKPIGYGLGEAEELMGMSAKLVGSTALLQGTVIRLHDHFLRGKLEQDPTFPTQEDHLGNLVDILVSLRKELSAVLELSISMQKKEVSDAFIEAFNKILFGSEMKQTDLFSSLVGAIVDGDYEIYDEEGNMSARVQEALLAKNINSFANGSEAFDGRVWSTAVSRMICTFLLEKGIGIVNKDEWQEIAYARDGESTSRFSDMERDEDPEFSFGLHSNMAWGIVPPSGLSDALATWNRIFAIKALNVQEIVKSWTPEYEDFKKDPSLVTKANRSIHHIHWKHIVPEMEVGKDLFAKYTDLYKSKFIWSTLGLKVGEYKAPDTAIDNKVNVELAKFASRARSPEATWLLYTFIRSRVGVAKSQYSEGFIHDETLKVFQDFYSKLPEECTQAVAEDIATQLIEELKNAARPHFKETTFEWMIGKLPHKEMLHLLWSGLVLLARLKTSDYVFNWQRGKQKREWRMFNGMYKSKFHPDAVRIIPLILLFATDWQPVETDFRELMGINKNIRGNMDKVKAPWRILNGEQWESLSPEEQINCWRVAFDGNLIGEIMKAGNLPQYEIWNRTKNGGAKAMLQFYSSSTNEQDEWNQNLVEEPKTVETQEYFFSMWGYEAMKEHGLKNSAVIGTSAANPRIPILIKNGADITCELKPIPLYEETNSRSYHATGLINKSGEVVGIICESLVIMRVLLAFDNITLNRLEVKEAKKSATFAPVDNFWRSKYPGFTRYNVEVSGFNKSLENEMADILEDLKDDLPEFELPTKEVSGDFNTFNFED
jgi:hypothetical protein